MTITRFTAAVALALAAVPAAARIVQIDVQRTETFAGGQAFGTRGAYVKIVGVAKGELDPPDRAQQRDREYRQGAAQRRRQGRVPGGFLHPAPGDRRAATARSSTT